MLLDCTHANFKPAGVGTDSILARNLLLKSKDEHVAVSCSMSSRASAAVRLATPSSTAATIPANVLRSVHMVMLNPVLPVHGIDLANCAVYLWPMSVDIITFNKIEASEVITVNVIEMLVTERER
jgi:hypothetical protein